MKGLLPNSVFVDLSRHRPRGRDFERAFSARLGVPTAPAGACRRVKAKHAPVSGVRQQSLKNAVDVPIFKEVDSEARGRLARTSKGYQERQVYREHLNQLGDDRLWEIQPDQDNSLRRIKVNVRRAGNELDLPLGYGETTEGTLLVWREEVSVQPTPWQQRRARAERCRGERPEWP
jgi:hypothetical protein